MNSKIAEEEVISISVVQDFGVAGLAPETHGNAESLTRRLTGDNASHVVSYATEGGLFQERGYSTVICGPGDIAQAHQPNDLFPSTSSGRAKRS